MEQTPQHGGEHIDVFTSIDLCDLCGKRGGGGVNHDVSSLQQA